MKFEKYISLGKPSVKTKKDETQFFHRFILRLGGFQYMGFLIPSFLSKSAVLLSLGSLYSQVLKNSLKNSYCSCGNMGPFPSGPQMTIKSLFELLRYYTFSI